MEGCGGPNKECSSKAGSSDDHGSTTDHSADDASSGRFYECIFCKRGFSTAQALGGHMNIHRKDRAKMSRHVPPASKPAGDQDESDSGSYVYNNQCRPFYPPVSESLKNYSMMFSPAPDPLMGKEKPPELSLFWEDRLGLGLSVRGDGRHGPEERREGVKEGEVDLELRLGP